MENAEVMKLIDSGANFYCRQLGNASHMEFKKSECYSIIYPKPGEQGGTSIFDVALEHLDDAEATKIIREIKSLNVHTWWGLCLSDRIYRLIFGTARPLLSEEEHANDEETYMALFPEEKPAYSKGSESIKVIRVASKEEFAIWADICNAVLHDNYPIIHRINHYDICGRNIMSCYLACHHSEPAGVSAILNNGGIASLEFVAVLPEYRKMGIGRSVCQSAVDEAFSEGAKVITTRAFKAAKHIYKALGFRIYF